MCAKLPCVPKSLSQCSDHADTQDLQKTKVATRHDNKKGSCGQK